MKKLIFALAALCCMSAFVACNDYETYGEKKEKERDAIRQFISDSSIVVISEDQFHAQGNVTDVSKNEFVYMNNTGVYMQIVNKGCGDSIPNGKSTTLIMRFYEQNIMDQSEISNESSPYDPDFIIVNRTGSTFTASYTSNSLMAQTYSSTSVSSGIMVPFAYINVGRVRNADDRIAKVRLIVPHTQGHTIAASYVYPYYYEITFQKKVDL
jgi:hypothetical protein